MRFILISSTEKGGPLDHLKRFLGRIGIIITVRIELPKWTDIIGKATPLEKLEKMGGTLPPLHPLILGVRNQTELTKTRVEQAYFGTLAFPLISLRIPPHLPFFPSYWKSSEAARPALLYKVFRADRPFLPAAGIDWISDQRVRLGSEHLFNYQYLSPVGVVKWNFHFAPFFYTQFEGGPAVPTSNFPFSFEGLLPRPPKVGQGAPAPAPAQAQGGR